jgi:hypothetical protein
MKLTEIFSTAAISKSFVILCILTTAIIGVGCEKGAMEEAGEKLDNAAEKTADKTKEGVKAVGEAAEKAGDKIKDATN